MPDFPIPALFILAADAGIFVLWLIFVIRKAPLKFHYAMICASLGIWLLGMGIACSLLREFGNYMGRVGVGDPSRLSSLMGDSLIVGGIATHTVIKLVVITAIGLLIYKPKPTSTVTSGKAVS
ncbi:hypothetical protein [Brevifollis gellanilyticus]|uniref:Uncharacterized protein n=1 Tax=Brevifollis gellanilyticus TaxID=748831 RepID=A0A512M632_9BACT|nr:hypothetical protein [Brevifollis gellanilyticus]GEP42190.1 hypothetical protein BGE01nite_14810 [Brevifollis gellanilyticus]